MFFGDAVAGVTVALVALPLSIAIAIASGADPKAGLVTAIIAGSLISLLGGSRVQIGGPTGAFIVVVYGIIEQHGFDVRRIGYRGARPECRGKSREDYSRQQFQCAPDRWSRRIGAGRHQSDQGARRRKHWR